MSEEKKVICSSCGSENEEQVKFCSNCGAKIEEAVLAEPAQTAVTEPETAKTETIPSGTADTPAEPVVNADQPAAESANHALEQSLLQGEPLTIESDPVIKAAVPTSEPTVAEPVYVEVATQTQTYTTAGTYTTVDADAKTGNGSPGFGIASMICGILSLLCCCFWPLSLVCSIVAIVLGIIAIYNKYDGKGMAIAGIVMGSIGIVVAIGILVLAGSASVLEALESYTY